MALVLGLTVAGFIVAGMLAERDARRESERRVAIAGAQIRGRVEAATSLTASLSRFMSDEGARGVTNTEFTRNALRWLSPADLPAAAWAEQVRAADRAAYERRIGRPIVAPGERRKAAPPASSSYLPATLVSGFPPLTLRGIDLRREPGIAAALGRAIRPGGVGATPVAARRDGTRGLFLVAPAPDLIGGVLRPGAVVLFVSEATLRAAARNPAGLRFPPAGRASADRAGGNTVREEFAVAGQQFAVVMPKESVSGPGAVLPWIILAGGLLLAALTGALGVIAARRARAQQDLDRIFNLSPDLVAVANFDGHFTRVNPAAEQILGYTEQELLTRPYLDLVHPDDRERTAAEAAAVGEGKRTLSFENRYARKDGSYRVLEWTATPVVEEAVMYGVARDVTERRKAEAEVERLAAEQSALRRVATLVAREHSPDDLFATLAEELGVLLEVDAAAILRYEPDVSATVVAGWSNGVVTLPLGARLPLEGENLAAEVLRTGVPQRKDDYGSAPGPIADVVRELGIRSAVASPIVVDGATWGVIAVLSRKQEPLPPDTEARLAEFSQVAGMAVANAKSRSDLAQSRARIVRAGDEARRHFERDLHDGAQQRLVSLGLELGGAEATVPPELGDLRSALSRLGTGLREVLEDLRELSRGLHPAVLTEGGLIPALSSLARRSAVPVDLRLEFDAERFEEPVEVTAYYVASEALTNTAKHAHASRVELSASRSGAWLELIVSDDGGGGADGSRGSGLTGLVDRVEAIGGTIRIDSRRGHGTAIHVRLPARTGRG